ncbi:hypothetical protein F4801DRAFT_547302 [Xylaria longipes]|nr:hypothetical protein F4801DRAFT_547302 [Xylaria longipes]
MLVYVYSQSPSQFCPSKYSSMKDIRLQSHHHVRIHPNTPLPHTHASSTSLQVSPVTLLHLLPPQLSPSRKIRSARISPDLIPYQLLPPIKAQHINKRLIPALARFNPRKPSLSPNSDLPSPVLIPILPSIRDKLDKPHILIPQIITSPPCRNTPSRPPSHGNPARETAPAAGVRARGQRRPPLPRHLRPSARSATGSRRATSSARSYRRRLSRLPGAPRVPAFSSFLPPCGDQVVNLELYIDI